MHWSVMSGEVSYLFMLKYAMFIYAYDLCMQQGSSEELPLHRSLWRSFKLTTKDWIKMSTWAISSIRSATVPTSRIWTLENSLKRKIVQFKMDMAVCRLQTCSSGCPTLIYDSLGTNTVMAIQIRTPGTWYILFSCLFLIGRSCNKGLEWIIN